MLSFILLCCILLIVKLNAIMLSVVMPDVNMLSVVIVRCQNKLYAKCSDSM
jgi:hypothetical protein